MKRRIKEMIKEGRKMEKFLNHTFVICAYKVSPYLEECIKSILAQSVQSNVLMVTSTPNEHIEKLAKKYNIKLIINKGKSGIGPDWNFGVSNTNTDYVTVAHQDDIYNSDYLENIVEKINKKKDFVIAFSDYNELKNGEVIPLTINLKIKKILLKPLKINNKSRFLKRIALRFGSSICCPSVTLNTRILGKTPYKTELKCNLDWDTWYECTKYKGRFMYIDKPLMKHRIHEQSETSNLIENNVRIKEDYVMFCKFWPNWFARIIMKFYKKAINTNG